MFVVQPKVFLKEMASKNKLANQKLNKRVLKKTPFVLHGSENFSLHPVIRYIEYLTYYLSN